MSANFKCAEFSNLEPSLHYHVVCTKVGSDDMWHVWSERAFELDRRLVEAARDGHVHGVSALLKRGARPNVRVDLPASRTFTTALTEAVAHGHVQVVRDLLHHGALPRLVAGNGLEPLEIANRLQRTDCAALLHAAGARTTLTDHRREAERLGLANRAMALLQQEFSPRNQQRVPSPRRTEPSPRLATIDRCRTPLSGVHACERPVGLTARALIEGASAPSPLPHRHVLGARVLAGTSVLQGQTYR
jgi:hypothetical protein